MSREEWLERMKAYDRYTPEWEARREKMFAFLKDGYWESRMDQGKETSAEEEGE